MVVSKHLWLRSNENHNVNKLYRNICGLLTKAQRTAAI